MRLLAAEKEVEQVVVGELHQHGRRPRRRLRLTGSARAKKRSSSRSFSSRPRRQRQRSLLSARASIARRVRAPGAAGGRAAAAVHQMARLTISSLILPMARVGLSCFGQTSTQFMIVWQRNSRYGSSRLSSRSLVACVAAVGDEAVGLQQPGRADELVGVPPEARAGGRAARAQDALVQAVQLVALLGRLQALLLGRRARR